MTNPNPAFDEIIAINSNCMGLYHEKTTGWPDNLQNKLLEHVVTRGPKVPFKIKWPVSKIHDGVTRNMNRVQKRKHLRALMLAGNWDVIKATYSFTPRFVKVKNGKSVFDWNSIPWNVRDILQCGGNVLETPFTQQGGIYDPNEKAKRVNPPKPALLPVVLRPLRHNLVERLPVRFRLYEDQKGVCHWCHLVIPKSQWTIEHLNPICRGGTNDYENLRGACGKCNSEKNWMTEAEYLEFRKGK